MAGFATTPYAAYHFHRIAPYGVLANLLAMPVVSAWVMPMGIFGVVAMPFGFDAVFWRQMGYGIEWMDAVALWVASLPGAFGRVTSFGTGPLLFATAGLLVIGLLKTPLRWSGVLLVVIAVIWAARTPVPDVLIAGDGRTFAVRGADGRLAFHHSGGDTFCHPGMARGRCRWPRREGSAGWGRGSPAMRPAVSASLPTARLVSYALEPDAFEEDCRRAMLDPGDPRRSAAGLRRNGHRPGCLARARCACAAARRHGLYRRRHAAGEFRPAVGAGSAAAAHGCRQRYGCKSRQQRRRVRNRATRRRGRKISRRTSESAQYRRNSPTSLP